MQNDKPKKKTRNGYRLIIYIDHKLKTAIQELATENSRPMVKEINRALKCWLEKHHGKPGHINKITTGVGRDVFTIP